MNGLKIEAPLRNKKCRHQPRFEIRGRRLQSLCWRELPLGPRTSAVDKVVDKLCALIVRDNLIKWPNSGSF